jgi:hypothetical protein
MRPEDYPWEVTWPKKSIPITPTKQNNKLNGHINA